MSELSEATPCESLQHRVDQCDMDHITRELRKDLTEKMVQYALSVFDSHEILRNCDENKRVNDTELESTRANKKLKRYESAEPELWSKSRETDVKYYDLYKMTFLQDSSCLKLVMSTPRELGINAFSLDDGLENNNLNASNISNMTNFSDSEDTSMCETFSRTNSELSNESSHGLKASKKRNKFANLKAVHQISMCYECVQSDEAIEENSDVICRFNGWRKLVYDRNTDKISEAGFLELTDATTQDYSLWEMGTKPETVSAELEESELKIISFVGAIFEQLVKHENNLRSKEERSSYFKLI